MNDSAKPIRIMVLIALILQVISTVIFLIVHLFPKPFLTLFGSRYFAEYSGLSMHPLLFAAPLLRLIVIAERQRDNYSKIYAYCVAGIFFFHLTINIGMVIGLLPVIGIPLPFFSYGGSSLISFTLLLAVLLRLDAERLSKWH